MTSTVCPHDEHVGVLISRDAPWNPLGRDIQAAQCRSCSEVAFPCDVLADGELDQLEVAISAHNASEGGHVLLRRNAVGWDANGSPVEGV